MDVLGRPSVYRLATRVLAIGAERRIRLWLERFLSKHARSGAALRGAALDVGCGPFSSLWPVGVEPVGADRSFRYALAFARTSRRAVVARAEELPFVSATFASVWSFGLLHHLDDGQARQALSELLRVLRPGGTCVIFDGILPERPQRRRLAWLIRRLDRGDFHRREAEFRALLPRSAGWQVERLTYTWSGLEGAFAAGLQAAHGSAAAGDRPFALPVADLA